MTIILDNGNLRLAVEPAAGASAARFDALTEQGPVALMRPGRERERDPNRLAMYPLVPWSNRIATGGFDWHGRRYDFAANLAGEPLPIHGDGWQRPWLVEARTQHEVRLTLRSNEQPPFDYRAELLYRLESESLIVELAVTHLGERSAPYGLGCIPGFRVAPIHASKHRPPVSGKWTTRNSLPNGHPSAAMIPGTSRTPQGCRTARSTTSSPVGTAARCCVGRGAAWPWKSRPNRIFRVIWCSRLVRRPTSFVSNRSITRSTLITWGRASTVWSSCITASAMPVAIASAGFASAEGEVATSIGLVQRNY
ncbi:hypothetical protein CAI21_16530 [Alkalilimnicola ehrlichii]|uniref:Aldose 1-epimerase n=1 Tax=Alkalilimnicola ehrlichii TaxID=351052 RepID=A0A3E0WLV9_9GAMM|nr:hypothetical protein [Alkalilimnicola ehrlichii]RFA26571.1 hypothetical protein CAI21_16530 [Alkalilimnicola ehrlichii]RFA32925.1 hypothetical protein CAL65_18465 [Alkalilimnicola ehrlichii]